MRQECVVGPTLFNLVFDDVCKKALKKSSGLNHLPYADDLVLIFESPAEAQKSMNVFNREVQREGMEFPFTKIEEMMANSDDPSDIILNVVKIKEVRSFNYLGSALKVEEEISEAVLNNCRKARIAFLKMIPALTGDSLRSRTKINLVENFIKPTLMYGLETAVIRKFDFGKLTDVLNKARKMILKQDSKRTCETAEKVPLKGIEMELAVGRDNFWASIVKLKADAVNSEAVKSKVYAKDCLRVLDLYLDILGIIRKDEWIKDPKPLNYNNEVDQSTQRMFGSRPQTVPCEAGNRSLILLEKKETQRHLRGTQRHWKKKTISR